MVELPMWHDFLSVSAGIGATLSGLVFVAVSINLKQIVSTVSFSKLALESLSQLLGAMMLALLAFLPGQSVHTLSIEVGAFICLLWLAQGYWQLDFLKHHGQHPRRWVVDRFIRTQLACIPFLIASGLLYTGHQSAMSWFATGLLLSFLAGVGNAWVLLVKIAQC